MTGLLGREFYDLIVDETNALDADLVVITGDILEKHACLPWIAPRLAVCRPDMASILCWATMSCVWAM